MPWTLGNECAGEVVSLGEGVDEATVGFKVGDKVAVSLSKILLVACYDIRVIARLTLALSLGSRSTSIALPPR